MKFIHAADLHIDSPLLGLEAYEGAPVERLREATREAFGALVSLAIEQTVDFVILAGDLFDGPWKDMKTGLWTAAQFRRLATANGGIPVYILRGNHDSASEVRKAVTWGENVHEFSVRHPQTFKLKDMGVALHGQGFAKRDVPHDLTDNYPQPVEGMFNIGVLHTSLTGSSVHDTYAPTSPQKLAALGYDYWALGHIHRRDIVNDSSPVIAFSGNTQGRHINESDAKGCWLVGVENGRIESMEFRATDVVRWRRLEIELDENSGRAELLDMAGRRFHECHEQSEGRLAAVRLTVSGRTQLHAELTKHETREELLAELRNAANHFDGEIWLEQIHLNTAPPIDRDKLKAGGDLLGELLRDIDRLADNDELLAETTRCLTPLMEKSPTELQHANVDPQDQETMRRWLRQAEGLLLAHLADVEDRG
ncbi:MAG: DNA repair exonuclease [Pirellulales bacterium]|nr:DNA repair exonuclease [Pirellulales bacterium]